jgi:hypothetical protein
MTVKGVERAFSFSVIPDMSKDHPACPGPRGRIWSHKRSLTQDLQNGLPRDIASKLAWRAAHYWCRISLQTDWMRRRVGTRGALPFRYEDLMFHTLPALQRFGDLIGINLTNVQRAIGR